MPEQNEEDRYYGWTRSCFLFVALLMALILVRFLTFGARDYWQLAVFLPLPFLFLLNLWLAFRRTHKTLQGDRDPAGQPVHSPAEALFGLSLTAACGLPIALIVGFLIGKVLGR